MISRWRPPAPLYKKNKLVTHPIPNSEKMPGKMPDDIGQGPVGEPLAKLPLHFDIDRLASQLYQAVLLIML